MAALIIATAATTISIGLVLLNPLEAWHLKLSNGLFTQKEQSQDIVIIAIDDKSIKDKIHGGLGRFSDWRRDYYVKAIENLKDKNTKAIGIDIRFLQKSTGMPQDVIDEIFHEDPDTAFVRIQDFSPLKPHPDDAAFAESIKENGVILGGHVEAGLSSNTINSQWLKLPLSVFWDDVQSIGLVNLIKDNDGMVRSYYPFYKDENDETYKSFALQFSPETALDEIPLDQNKRMLINFYGKPYSFKQISFSDVYSGNFEQQDVDGKIALVGLTTTSVQDHVLVPTSEQNRDHLSLDNEMPGVEVHANALQTLLDGSYLQNQSHLDQFLTIAAISFTAALLLTFLNIWFGIGVLVLLLAGYYGAAHITFKNGLIINMIYPFIAILITYLASIVYKYFAELRAKKFIQKAFSRYLSPNVMKSIMKNPDMLNLGGMKREITVFFSDIAGFTTVSEQLDPEHLLLLINDYLTAMTDIVLDHEGTLDKYVGDAIVAYFGAPMTQEDHAKKACAVALEMREMLPQLHEEWATSHLPLVNFRIGINTGEAIVGNVGSETRSDYTIMGDEVNLGSRLEGANKKYGTNIMISESTYKQIGSDFVVRELDHIKVKGKTKPVRVYELLSHKGRLSEVGQKLLAPYNEGMRLYLARDFKKAYEEFKKALEILPEDGPSKLYVQRCDVLTNFPPPENWDGVFTMQDK